MPYDKNSRVYIPCLSMKNQKWWRRFSVKAKSFTMGEWMTSELVPKGKGKYAISILGLYACGNSLLFSLL
jgi:hypothetical protein